MHIVATRKLTGLTASLVLGVSMGVAALPAAAASASTVSATASAASCDGKLIDVIAVKKGSKKYGTLQLYWNASSGKNCAIVYRNVDPGAKKFMEVHLWTCRKGQTAGQCTRGYNGGLDYKSDTGLFGKYAGPVRVRARNLCLHVEAAVHARNDTFAKYSSPVFHCG